MFVMAIKNFYNDVVDIINFRAWNCFINAICRLSDMQTLPDISLIL
jgi:hypothetical protein